MPINKLADIAERCELHVANLALAPDLTAFLLDSMRYPMTVDGWLSQRAVNGRLYETAVDLHARIAAIEAALRRADLGAAARGERPPFAP